MRTFFGQRRELERIAKLVSVVLGIVFCSFAVYSFSVDYNIQSANFFRHFMESARLEFALIGAIGLLMFSRWI